jgi:hypothetical protein
MCLGANVLLVWGWRGQSLRLALQPRSPARALFHANVFEIFEFVGDLFATAHFPF